MAVVTRLWPYGGPGHPYGSFAGKSEQVIVEPPAQGSRGGGRIYPYPQDPPKKKPKVIHRLEPYEVTGPLARQREIENWKLPEWDQEAWEASLKTLQYLEKERRVRRQKNTESALAIWMLAG